MLTGSLYLSSDLRGGVFDEASRSLDERSEEVNWTSPENYCRWTVRGNKIRFDLGLSRVDQGASRNATRPLDASLLLHFDYLDPITRSWTWTATTICTKLTLISRLSLS
jgi:hypothetical protein